jgi:hypothetical protein
MYVHVFSDATYSQKLLSAAKSLYDFAKGNQGTYDTTAIPDASKYYQYDCEYYKTFHSSHISTT